MSNCVVKVAFPISFPGVFDYLVPPSMVDNVEKGAPVKVPLRSRTLWGIVVAVTTYSRFKNLKNVIEFKSKDWQRSGREIFELYEWMASYYQTDLGMIFKPLIHKKMADIDAKRVFVYRRNNSCFFDNLTGQQTKAMKQIEDLSHPLSLSEIKNQYGISSHMVKKLTGLGLLEREKIVIDRVAPELKFSREMNYKLSKEQQCAVDLIWSDYEKPKKPFLLYGITGSGKTHVYIELARRTLAAQKNVIILVPEITLTPQTIQRFRSALKCDIAVIHSRMSTGERRDSIENIVSGKCRIVIGVRSAILVPMNNVGCIVVDEEHDGSYKQSEPEPRYHARDVAVMRGHFQHALVVLGSATPSFESFANTKNDKYYLVNLIQRFGNAILPNVTLIDMRQEHKQKNFTILSMLLQIKIEEVLNEKRQIILFLNRRGFSHTLLCKGCGEAVMCPHCSVRLIYHKNDLYCKCHQCGYEIPLPDSCPVCGYEKIDYKGTGIQKAEEYIAYKFPMARILRMDQDTTRNKGSYIDILEKFASREADILIGTQMVAKGLNFPGVRLVGVLQADVGLSMPDFRAAEKTFQLLSQVSGRAGRTDANGEVIIQTYAPHEPALISAQMHDFPSFYEHEVIVRRHLCYPPFGKLCRIVIMGELKGEVCATSDLHAKFLSKQSGIYILGPSPAAIVKLRGMFRYSILLKSFSSARLNSVLKDLRVAVTYPQKKVKRIIDVDPINML